MSAATAAMLAVIVTLLLVGAAGVVAARVVLGTGGLKKLRYFKKGKFFSDEELLGLIDAAVEDKVLDQGERELIGQIIEFGDTVVREVMVPRPDMVAVPTDMRVVDVMEIVLLNGYSRMPVYRDGMDDIAGLVYTKDLMRADRDGHADLAVGTLVRQAHVVPENKRLPELLSEMQSEQYHMAIVVDEYGGTSGLVTLEDLIEELVGEIVDEFDREEPMMEPLAGGAVRVNARMSVDEVNELVHAELPEGDWDTIGGLVFHLLGHIPVDGETVVVDGHQLRAERVQGRRIGRVRIDPAPEPQPGEEAAAESASAEHPDSGEPETKKPRSEKPKSEKQGRSVS